MSRCPSLGCPNQSNYIGQANCTFGGSWGENMGKALSDGYKVGAAVDDKRDIFGFPSQPRRPDGRPELNYCPSTHIANGWKWP